MKNEYRIEHYCHNEKCRFKKETGYPNTKFTYRLKRSDENNKFRFGKMLCPYCHKQPTEVKKLNYGY